MRRYHKLNVFSGCFSRQNKRVFFCIEILIWGWHIWRYLFPTSIKLHLKNVFFYFSAYLICAVAQHDGIRFCFSFSPQQTTHFYKSEWTSKSEQFLSSFCWSNQPNEEINERVVKKKICKLPIEFVMRFEICIHLSNGAIEIARM